MWILLAMQLSHATLNGAFHKSKCSIPEMPRMSKCSRVKAANELTVAFEKCKNNITEM